MNTETGTGASGNMATGTGDGQGTPTSCRNFIKHAAASALRFEMAATQRGEDEPGQGLDQRRANGVHGELEHGRWPGGGEPARPGRKAGAELQGRG